MNFIFHVRHFFTPHHTNNHRARALHTDAMFLYAIGFLLFNVIIRVVGSVYPSVLGYATNIQVEQLLAETNSKRQSAGLAPLTLNQQLSQAAAGKAADMFGNDYWAHVSPQGKTPWDFIVGAGYRYSVAGENLAKNFQDSAGVVNAWMNSPTHKENLLKPNYKEVGFAVVNGRLQGEETTLVVQMFGTKPSTRVVEAAEPSIVPEKAVQPEKTVADSSSVKPVEQIQIAANPVEIPEIASRVETPAQNVWENPFSKVIMNPKIDITALRRDISMIFAGIFMGIFAVDMYLAMKKHSVRAVGSSVAHVLFVAAILFSMNIVTRGSLL